MGSVAHHSLAIWPDRESGLGMRSWLGETARLARISAFPPKSAANDLLPRGDGQAVLVIPGFLTNDGTTGRLRRFLSGLGYRAEGWQNGFNLGPRTKAIACLKERVAALGRRQERAQIAVGLAPPRLGQQPGRPLLSLHRP